VDADAIPFGQPDAPIRGFYLASGDPARRLPCTFWLTPTVHVAVNIGLSPSQLRAAQAVVEAHIREIEDAWSRHFGS